MSVCVRPIQLLSVTLRNQIAAGEVVERPASAMKELVENSLDAGASQIDVRLDNGGRDCIVVQDDGCGIPHESLALAVTRHATSKITSIDDLETLTSFGFRGEALPSIAAVSRFSISSAYAGESFALDVNFGTIGDCVPTSLPKGTLVTVRDLFANTPARLKFLKTPSTEVKRAEELLFRIALANCSVGFTFSVATRTVRTFLPGETIETRLKAFWSPEVVDVLVPFTYRTEGLSVHGLAAPPTLSQVRANHIYLYVNGRAIQDKKLLAAVKDAYKGHLIAREYPQCLLFLEIDPHDVDVNVHPAKTEVRFRDESFVFRSCLRAVQSAIAGDPLCQESSSAKGASYQATYTEPTVSETKTENFDTADTVQEKTINENFVSRPKGFWGSLDTLPIFSSKKRTDDSFEEPVIIPREKSSLSSEPTEKKAEQKSTRSQETQTTSLPGGLCYLGQIAATYLLFETSDHALLILDQHAAHERILYERLHTRAYAGKAQMLMVPFDLPLSKEEQERLCAIRDTLVAMGYTLKTEGERVVVASIPPMLPLGDAKVFLQEALAEQKDDADALIKRMACRAAIKAGQKLSFEEVVLLLGDWYATPNRGFCPHGRPTLLVWDVAMLEKAFKRV